MKFKPSDFDGSWHKLKAVTYEEVAEIANRKLSEWLSRAPLVYGTIPDDPRWIYELSFDGVANQSDTHVARLVDIEEIDNEDN